MARARRPDQIIISIAATALMYAPIAFAGFGIGTSGDVISAFLTPEFAILIMILAGFLIAPKWTRDLFETYRWPSFDLVLGALGFAVVILFLRNEVQLLDFNSVLLVCEFGCAVLGFANGINTYYDHHFAVDSKEWVGDDERLVAGDTTVKRVILDTVIALVVSLLLLWRMSYIQGHDSLSLIGLSLFAIGILYAYTGSPFTFKYRCLGEVCVILFAFSVMLLMSLMLNGGAYSRGFLVFAFFIAVLRGLPNYMFNVRDFMGDKAAGIMTLPILLGERGVKFSFVAIVVFLTIFTVLVAQMSGFWLLLSGITLPLGLYASLKRSYSLPMDRLYEDGLMMEYIQYYFLTLMIACYIQVIVNL